MSRFAQKLPPNQVYNTPRIAVLHNSTGRAYINSCIKFMPGVRQGEGLNRLDYAGFVAYVTEIGQAAGQCVENCGLVLLSGGNILIFFNLKNWSHFF